MGHDHPWKHGPNGTTILYSTTLCPPGDPLKISGRGEWDAPYLSILSSHLPSHTSEASGMQVGSNGTEH